MLLRLCLCLCLIIPFVHGEGVTAGRPMNVPVDGSPCVRLFHSKGSIGCGTSDFSGLTAPLYAIRSAADISSFRAKAQESVVVLSASLFNSETLDQIRSLTAGILVFPANSAQEPLSPASTTPQGSNSIDEALNPFPNAIWNPSGLNLLEQSFAFPIVLVQSQQAGEELVEQAMKNLHRRSDTFSATYKADLSYYFGKQEITSRECLGFTNILGQQDAKCDPIGGQSAWGSLGPALSTGAEVVLAMTALDSTALAHELAMGANAGASGTIALLAAAEALGKLPTEDWTRTVMFAAFQAESFGFVGSRRFVQDIGAGAAACNVPVEKVSTPFGSTLCTDPMSSTLAFQNVSLDRIAFAVGIDQVALTSNTADRSFFLHANPTGTDTAVVTGALTAAPSAGGRVLPATSAAVPPGPMSSFINAAAGFNGVVLAGFNTEFVPGTYHSRFDVKNDTTSVENIAFAAQIVAEGLYNLGTNGAGTQEITINSTLVTLLSDCFTSNWRCELMDQISAPFVNSAIEYMNLSPSMWPDIPFEPVSLYSGTYRSMRQPVVRQSQMEFATFSEEFAEESSKLILFPNAYETFVRSFLAHATGVNLPSSKGCTISQDCDDAERECVFPGRCVARTSYFHNALDPGLTAGTKRRVFSIAEDDSVSPIWTEPVWGDIGGFVFSDPGNTIGWISILLGLLLTGAGVLLAFKFLRSFQKQKLL